MKVSIPSIQRARIEMLPLIDIVFLLLVFFIYAMLSMAVHRGVPVELPLSSAPASPEKQDLVSVSIRDNGRVFLDGLPVTVDRLSQYLEKVPLSRKQRGLLLFADAQISYQHLFDVLDVVRAANIHRISLQMEERPAP